MKGYSYFLNRRNSADGFKESINGSIFVDKSLLIDFVNEMLSTKEKWILREPAAQVWEDDGAGDAGGLLYKRNPYG